MRKTLTLIVCTALAASTACNRDSKLKRDQQNYEVVQEGSGGAVSSTISAPGEVPPPAPALTGTNFDTTSAFMLPSTTMPTETAPPGTIAGTLPQPPVTATYYPRTPPRPRPVTPPPTATAPPADETQPAPPPATDTTSTQPPPEKPPDPPPPTTATQTK